MQLSDLLEVAVDAHVLVLVQKSGAGFSQGSKASTTLARRKFLELSSMSKIAAKPSIEVGAHTHTKLQPCGPGPVAFR